MYATIQPVNATTAMATITYVNVNDEDGSVEVDEGRDVSTVPALPVGADDMVVGDVGITIRSTVGELNCRLMCDTR